MAQRLPSPSRNSKCNALSTTGSQFTSSRPSHALQGLCRGLPTAQKQRGRFFQVWKGSVLAPPQTLLIQQTSQSLLLGSLSYETWGDPSPPKEYLLRLFSQRKESGIKCRRKADKGQVAWKRRG